MKFADHLTRETRKRLEQLHHRKKPPSVIEPSNSKNTEQLSRREWEDIMGKNRDTYKRVRGAVRRK